ncbi:SIMPL domain-containing protein [Microbacterium sp. ARD32]|uniref:SIMPL domain-containing protein n=1 Tax=Microbacterium sp. ARD32 TaxID=2962577 RepID=UPI0028820FF9|nr:SIMPL domain-containing protein [Microbacterium sp. ARD32]MDT0156968.1 SIMPL domain-containing protein [Microbacterium sp. ARD32]
MSEVIISVRGEHQLRVAPEHATVHLSISFDGPDRATAVEQTLEAAGAVRDGIESRTQSGSVSAWTSQRLNVHADRPWNSDGRRLAPVYRAAVDLTVTFSDFSEMSIWATEVTVQDGVSIGFVDWRLTAQTEAEVEREVATRAVAVAVARARAYAEALGLSEVAPVEIADRGLISENMPALPKVAMMRSPAMDAGSTPAMEFQGEDITVSAAVEGRFRAS